MVFPEPLDKDQVRFMNLATVCQKHYSKKRGCASCPFASKDVGFDAICSLAWSPVKVSKEVISYLEIRAMEEKEAAHTGTFHGGGPI